MRFLVYLSILLLAAGSALADPPAPSCSLVPGWTQQGQPRSYTSDNLFEYMDGNAEGYLIYGFQKMAGVTCVNGGDTFVVDISEFADPDSAYGMFTSNRDAQQPTAQVGMAGQLVPRRLIFVKDKYFFEIAANPAKDHTPGLKAFAAKLETLVQGRTTLPEALLWFPTENLQKESIRLIPESVLGLRILKRGYVGLYDFGKAFLVKESSPDAAAAVIAKWKTRIGETKPAQLGDEAFEARDKYLGGLYVFRKGVYIGGIANLKEGTDGAPMAKALAAKIP
jgi:hypothetical protein